MESEVKLSCQGSECNAAAVAHLAFGLRVFEAAPEDIHISEIPYSTEHRDLCTDHREQVRRNYVNVTEFELGLCPSHPLT